MLDDSGDLALGKLWEKVVFDVGLASGCIFGFHRFGFFNLDSDFAFNVVN